MLNQSVTWRHPSQGLVIQSVGSRKIGYGKLHSRSPVSWTHKAVLISCFVFIYLDDIVIYSQNQTQHENHVRQILERLLENQLFIKYEKGEFHVNTMQFLGYIIEAGRIRPDPFKIEAVLNWETPGTHKKLQQFLGFANFYRCFIQNYSSIDAPLSRLTSTRSVTRWTPEAQNVR